MKILHVLPSLATSYGGPVRVARSMIGYLLNHGHEARIYPFDDEQPKGKLFMPSRSGLRKLKANVLWADIVHLHGLWNLPTTLAAFFARNSRTPYVVNPHGMLDSWSLQQSAFVKKIYSLVFERKNLLSASGLCCTHQEEVDEALKYADFTNIFILPNGIEVRKFDDLPCREEMEFVYPQVKEKVVIFFMARIHYKKGLDKLVEACSILREHTNQFHLVIAGEDEGGHLTEIHKLIDKLKLNQFVTFVGEVLADKKRILMGGADIFALTSHQEGDSISIKEAMASSLPLLISRQCHYPEFQEMGLAKIVSTDPFDIALSLKEMVSDRDLRMEMGAKSRSYVEKEVDIEVVNSVLLEIYSDILQSRKTSKSWKISE